MFETAFAVALLAALGVDRILGAGVGRKFFIAGGIALGLIALLGVSGGFATIVGDMLAGNPRISPEAIDANGGAVTAGAFRMLLFGGAALALVWATVKGTIPRHVAPWAIVAVVAIDLWSIERKYWQFSPPASEIFADDAIAAHIRADSSHGRVFTIQLGEDAAYRDPYLGGDAFMSLGVRHVSGYHGNELDRYRTLFVQAGPGGARTMPDLVNSITSSAFGTLTNLRWFYTNVDALPPPFEKVLGPVKNGVGTNGFLYRIPGEQEQAWVVPAIMKAPDEATFATLLQRDFLRNVAIFDTSAAVDGEDLTELPAPLALKARVTRYAPGAIDIELDQPAPAKSALVVSENFYPGWRATVDGAEATVGRANFVIMGVPLTAGARRIELRFTDAAYETGKMVTIISILLAVLATAGGFVLDRRRLRA
jgi:hypothetical protein